MDWKRSIDDVKVFCKTCECFMIIESVLNDSNGIFGCPKCKEHINLKVMK